LENLLNALADDLLLPRGYQRQIRSRRNKEATIRTLAIRIEEEAKCAAEKLDKCRQLLSQELEQDVWYGLFLSSARCVALINWEEKKGAN